MQFEILQKIEADKKLELENVEKAEKTTKKGGGKDKKTNAKDKAPSKPKISEKDKEYPKL